MRKMLELGLFLVFVLGVTGNTLAQDFVPSPDRRIGDELKKIYSELRVGMDIEEVRAVIQKDYPSLKIGNIFFRTDFKDISTSSSNNKPNLLVLHVTEGGVADKYGYFPQVSLVAYFDFDKELFGLVNAQYTKYKTRMDFIDGKLPVECQALVKDQLIDCK